MVFFDAFYAHVMKILLFLSRIHLNRLIWVKTFPLSTFTRTIADKNVFVFGYVYVMYLLNNNQFIITRTVVYFEWRSTKSAVVGCIKQKQRPGAAGERLYSVLTFY